MVYLDEKQFYLSSNRKKAKFVPKGEYEVEEPVMPTITTVSHTHSTKIMYFGVIGTPIEGKFDGKIMLKRVSETKTYQKLTWSDQFSGNIIINNIIRNERRQFVHPSMSGKEMALVIGEGYHLEKK